MSTTANGTLPPGKPLTAGHKKVIFASSLGTVFEWYDFYLYGSLAVIIAKQFFSGVNETTGFIFALAAFAAGFAVRPFGALVFGRIGDLVGRKNTFLVTMGLMGASTFLVGVLPSYASIGVAAPVLLVVLRLLQGLALGGEYGGAELRSGIGVICRFGQQGIVKLPVSPMAFHFSPPFQCLSMLNSGKPVVRS